MLSAFSKKQFLILAVIAALCATLALSYAGLYILRSGGLVKVRGWEAANQGGVWVVTDTLSPGPALGKLKTGDRIVAIDGMRLAARIGPEWVLSDNPEKRSYSVEVNRGGADITEQVRWPAAGGGGGFWAWMYLLEGFIYLYTGIGIAFAKPESMSGRRAFAAAVLMAGFSCAATLKLQSGMLSEFAFALECVSLCVVPYHAVAGYLFTCGFPLDEPETGKWRWLAWFIKGGALLIWLPHAGVMLVRALGREYAIRFATNHSSFVLFYEGVINPLLLNLTTSLISIAIVLVCLRNYRRLTDPTSKRRLRWVIFGMGAGAAPFILIIPMVGAAVLTGRTDSVAVVRNSANAFGIIIPLCVAYAVVKHRILGIRVVLREGVQYLLARNVLRVALLCPLLFLIIDIASHLHESLADLSRGNAGRLNLGLLLLSAMALTYRTRLLNRIDRRFFREVYRQDQIFVRLAEAVASSASIDEVSCLLGTEIQSAMHPRVVLLVARASQKEFSMLYSESVERGNPGCFDFSLSPSQFEHLDSSCESASTGDQAVPQAETLQRLGIHLIVPVRGPNEGFLGMLLLGERRSEEPYSRNDRRLLDMIASHTGVVWENLRLRERLRGEQEMRKTVMTRIDGAAMEMVQECPACGACYDAGEEVCGLDGRKLVPSLPMARLIDGKYLLTRLIGRGGMGVVYEAEDKRLSRIVAVKVTAGSLFGNQAALQRFGREARAAAKLNHPNVVRVFDLGELPGGGAYMVFEFLRGVTLRHEIRRRTRLPIADACRVLNEVASGMEEAHRLRVVHRDLKPENVFLARDSPESPPVAKILDFGLAFIRDFNFSASERLTQTGSVIGTLTYMSREQFLGEAVDERTDIYSLGIVALETISGEIATGGLLFPRIGDVLKERLCSEGSAVGHQQLAGILRKALAEDREARYKSIREFRSALIPALTECPAIGGIAGGDMRGDVGTAVLTRALDE